MRRYVLCTIFVILAILGGCSRSHPDKTDSPAFQKINFNPKATEIMTFTVSSDGDLYLLETDCILRSYQSDGTLIKEYKDTQDFTALCWKDGLLYAYDAVKLQIVSINTDNGEKKVISENFKVDEVLKLVVVQEDLYVLAVPQVHEGLVPGLNGYTDFGEKLYRVDLDNGKIKETAEDNIIAIYGASDGALYYYAYRDDKYTLYRYITKGGKSTEVYDMSDTGYISAFIYEKDYFVCSTTEDMAVKALHPLDGSVKLLQDHILLLSGNDMVCEKGNVVYYGINEGDTANAVQTIYLEDIDFNKVTEKDGSASADTSSDPQAENTDNNTVVISTPYRAYHSTATVKRISGINAKIVDQSMEQEALLAEIMSGNSDVDIYITGYGSNISNAILDKSIYVPLNDSEVISSYRDQCFAYIADAMKSPNGELWMLPLALFSNEIWYVPENIDKFSVDLEDFRYLDSFLSLTESMPKTGTYAAYVDAPANFGDAMRYQYDMTYNEFKTKKVNYETDLYKHIFDKMWTGWVAYSQNPKHPLFRSSRDEYNGDLISKSPFYDKSKVIYKMDSLDGQLTISEDSLEGWRVLPLPRISAKVKENEVFITCAFINPNSKNKELAIKYLEAITQDPFGFDIACSPFIFKDKSIYAEQFDTSQPAFDDIYHIIEESMLNQQNNPPFNFMFVDDYQNGRLTLDEAVAAIQREAEMWLNE